MATEMRNYGIKQMFYIQNTDPATKTFLLVKFRAPVFVTTLPGLTDLVGSNKDGTKWVFGSSTGWVQNFILGFEAVVGFNKSLGMWNSGAVANQWGFASDVVYKWHDFWSQRKISSDLLLYDPAELEG